MGRTPKKDTTEASSGEHDMQSYKLHTSWGSEDELHCGFIQHFGCQALW